MKQLIYFALLILFPMISYSQTLSGINPNTVNAGQTLDVTITGSGTHFTDPDGTQLYFGFASGSSTSQDCINTLTVVDDVTLTANISVPSFSSGTYDILVINSIDGSLLPITIFVIANAAELTGITPNSTVAGQTLDVTITGTNTHFSSNTNTVGFGISQASGTINVNSVTVVDDYTLTANISVGANTYTGDFPLSVSNIQDGIILFESFEITGLTPAQIVSVNPNSGNAGQTLNLLISGTGTVFSQAANSLDIGFGQGVGVNSIDVYNDSLLLANVTIPAGTYTNHYDVIVDNSINGTLTKTNGLLVYGSTPPGMPAITITPNSANAGQTLSVTITGTNTSFTQASTTASAVYMTSSQTGETIEGTFTIVSNTSITAIFTIPAGHVSEDMDFHAHMTSDGDVFIYNGFHINGVNPVFAFVIPTLESAEGACDGSSQIVVSGGTAPYVFTVNGSSSGSSTATGLCEGLYDALVMDANGEQATISFVIVPPTGVYTTQTYIDSIMNDTIYNDVITNCEIDYDAIDEIYIESVVQLGGNQILVTWHVTYGSGQFVNITDTYDLSDFSGVYSLALELFCPNKSLSSFVLAYDQIYYGQGVAGITDKDEFSNALVYPNPFSGTVSIELGQAQETTITLMDLSGKVVMTASSPDKLIQLNTDQLASGQYMMILQGTSSVVTRKVVKL